MYGLIFFNASICLTIGITIFDTPETFQWKHLIAHGTGMSRQYKTKLKD